MTKRKSPPALTHHRSPVVIKASDEIMMGGVWYTITDIKDGKAFWSKAGRDGNTPLTMITQAMVRPGAPLPEVADDPDCQAVAATLGSQATHFSKIVRDDDRGRAAVILRVRGKDENKIVLPPSLKVVGSGQGWRAVRHTTPDDVQAAQAAYDADLAARAPKFNGDHVVATDDPDQKVGIFQRAGDDKGTIRYPYGRMVIRPLALIRLADEPLRSAEALDDDTDFVAGDLVYNVKDKSREIAVFYADQQPGYASLQYTGNRRAQVDLGDVRAAAPVVPSGYAEYTEDEELLPGEPQPLPEFIDPADLTTEEIDDIIDTVAADLSTDAEVDAAIESDAIDLDAPIDDEQPTYQKGDKLHAANGITYTVVSVEGEWVRLKHAKGEINLKAAEIPALLHAEAEPDWQDEVVRVSAELIEAKERIRQLEAELAQAAVNAAGAVELIELDQWEIESWTLPPVDVFKNDNRLERDRLLARFRNDGWFVVYENTLSVLRPGEILSVYHTARLERPLKDVTPGERSAIEQAEAHMGAIIGLDDPNTVIEGVNAETETTLQPVCIRPDGDLPLSDAINRYGVQAVKTFLNTQTCEVFNLARAQARAALTPGGES